MTQTGRTLEEFKQDLRNLEQQIILTQGAMLYVKQQIADLEKKQKTEKQSKSEGGKD